jgi:2-amino-4-hydroxy-6-hydroxymethyldihydropteridine diphosphokinase
MALVYLGLGTNLGDKDVNLDAAILHISTEVGHLVTRSSNYQSQALGFVSDNLFLNAVVGVETKFSPIQVLRITQQIERELGRTTKSSGFYSDRIIDIDILLYDAMILDTPELKIPHPLIAERDFVLYPLLEIAEKLIHPISNKYFSDYLSDKV